MDIDGTGNQIGTPDKANSIIGTFTARSPGPAQVSLGGILFNAGASVPVDQGTYDSITSIDRWDEFVEFKPIAEVNPSSVTEAEAVNEDRRFRNPTVGRQEPEAEKSTPIDGPVTEVPVTSETVPEGEVPVESTFVTDQAPEE